MILIADSGSTKTTWSIVDRDKSINTCTTGGINPFLSGFNDITQLLETEFTLQRNGITEIWFYGAGCAFPDKNQMLADALSQFFGTSAIHVNSDLLAAAHALCGHGPGIACILGTGSNSCFYDGRSIVQNISPLGFILGDEGGGAVLGRKLLSDIFKNQLSQKICDSFFATYPVTVGEVLENVYRKPFPNRYLAQYAGFVAAHIDFPEMQTLVSNNFRDFFRRNVVQYETACDLPVHFTGGIAFQFKDILKNVAESFGLTTGKIYREPMQGLIEYHVK